MLENKQNKSIDVKMKRRIRKNGGKVQKKEISA